MILVDTNILVRVSDQADQHYKTTHGAIAGCWRKGRQLFVSNQSLQEFWAVATRSTEKNGLGFSFIQANRFIDHFLRTFIRISDPPALFETWRTLVYGHQITGIRAYDARLAAFVQAQGFSGLMTYNLDDFKKFTLKLIDPRDDSTW
jgi:predicted nucleic acid-binding protein